MLRRSPSPATLALKREGGAAILAQVEIWKRSADDWKLQATLRYQDAVQPLESHAVALAPGAYTCVFQCHVQEVGLNGTFRFELQVSGEPTYADAGDVNTGTSEADFKAYKDQFELVIS